MPTRPTSIIAPRMPDTGTRLFLMGVALIVVAFIARLPSAAINTAMISGVAVALIGVAAPRISELEIGPGGFKTKLRDLPPQQSKGLEISTEQLSEFAVLACGDSLQARELIESAIARTGGRAENPQDERTLHRLIDLLESAADRRWLQSYSIARSSETSGPHAQRIIDHLQELEFFPRVCFLLHAQLRFTPNETARVLERPVDDVLVAIEQARDVTLPNNRTVDA